MKKQILLLMITSSAIIFASDPKAAQSTAKIQNQDPEQFKSFNVETENLYIEACDIEVDGQGIVHYKLNKTLIVSVSTNENMIAIQGMNKKLLASFNKKKGTYSIQDKLVCINANSYEYDKTKSNEHELVFVKRSVIEKR